MVWDGGVDTRGRVCLEAAENGHSIASWRYFLLGPWMGDIGFHTVLLTPRPCKLSAEFLGSYVQVQTAL